jgi:hypothetical protein
MTRPSCFASVRQRRNVLAVTLCAGMGSVFPASAATTYRCEVDGKVAYSDAPCPLGKQSTLVVDDPRSAEDRAEAARRSSTDHAQAREIDRERAKQAADDAKRVAAQARRAGADRANRTKTCARLARQAASARDASDLAGPSDQQKTRLKAQRADEEFNAVCKRA